MNHYLHTPIARQLLSLVLGSSLMLVLVLALSAQAAPVQLATSPLATSSSTLVKPNLMFMLDDSGSMDWDYMPDTAKDFKSAYGFNSSQCNGVYYNPAITYTPPVDSTGTSFGDSSFTNAWDDGYNKTAGSIDLSTAFIGGSGGGASGIKLTPQQAFYYTYSGTQTTSALQIYLSTSTFYRECNSAVGAAPGFGLFTKHLVNATSGPGATDERTNFANWYSYYSTRMLMMKTGVGLAFRTMTDKFRVGFMTMNNNVSPDFVDINTFDATQKSAWYAKLYGANPGQSTPLRQALSQVGSYYANKYSAPTIYSATITVGGSGTNTSVTSIKIGTGTFELLNAPSTTPKNKTSQVAKDIVGQINANALSLYDATASGNVITITGPSTAVGLKPIIVSNNSGITFDPTLITAFVATTGVAQQLNGVTPNDPMQYSCQKNFVILSTDGYWNGNAGYKLDGSAIGNQDGLAPRPMYDGGLATQTTSQIFQTQTQITKTISQTKKRTTQQQKQISQLQSQASIQKIQTSTLQVTGGAQVLMQCTGSTTTCGSAPSSPNNTTWTAVSTPGSYTNTASIQYAKGTVSGTIPVSVANACDAGGSITSNSTASAPPNQVSAAPTSANDSGSSSHLVGLAQGITAPDTSRCTTIGTHTGSSSDAWFCRGSGSNAPSYTTYASVPNPTPSWYLTTSNSSNVTACISSNIAFGYAASNPVYACPSTAGAPSSYTLVNPDSTGNVFAANSCSYTSWSSATPTSSCSAIPQSTASPYVLTATQCPVTTSGTAVGVATCTATTPNASGNFTACNTVVTSPFSGNNVTCGASNVTTVPDASGNTIQCQTTDTGVIGVPTGSCTAVATNSSGLTVTCDTTPATSYVASCPTSNCATSGSTTSGTSCASPYTATSCIATSYTTAKLMDNQLVDACACTGTSPCTASTPDLITTSCSTTSTPVNNVSSCTPQAASASNSHTSITCTGASGGTSDTLADTAMYYYETDLRTPALGNCGTPIAPATVGPLCDNNVPTTDTDPNDAQHLTTFTLGLGARGKMAFTNTDYMNATSGDFYDVKKGTTANPPTVCSWQSTGSGACNWPTPASNSVANIDDLWHAAIDGRGNYCNATDPSTLSSCLTATLKTVDQVTGAAAAAATSTLNPTTTDNFAYVASYTTVKWTGNLEQRTINIVNGVVSETASWCVESIVADICDATHTRFDDNSGSSPVVYCQISATTAADCVTPDVFYDNGTTKVCRSQIQNKCTGTMPNKVLATSDNRNILTPSGGALVQFNAAYATANPTYFDASKLSQGASSIVTASATTTNLINYLRGQNGFEKNRGGNAPLGANNTTTLDHRIYRYRDAVFGDPLESQPTFVSKPTFSYADAGYSAFAAAKAGREGMVFIGANDGMLHAFHAKDKAGAAAPCVSGTTGSYCGGEEAWAFVPSVVAPNMWHLADDNYSNNHVNYVNGPPVISDICPKDPPATCAATEWKTILVGGLNAGGREYYALDITNPAVDPILLWEFMPAQNANLGYSFGRPVITKKADGTWVVLVSSGYDNGTLSADNVTANSPTGDGLGHLFVLKAATGAVISDIATPSTAGGTAATPSGLAKFNAYSDVAGSNQAGFVYGGDLLGNVWRFDINTAATPLLFATLKDPSGVAQPITAAPTLGLVNKNHVIFVGTGKYLETADLTSTQQQSLYAIKDDGTSVGSPRAITKTGAAQTDKMVKQIITTSGSTRSIVNTSTSPNNQNPVDFNVDRGWFVDFPDSKERTNIDFKLAQGTLLVPTIVPTNSACSPGGYGWLNYFNFENGNAVSPGNVVSQRYDSPIVGMNVIFINGQPIVEVVTSNNPTPSKPTKSVPFRESSGGFIGKREVWRELIP